MICASLPRPHAAPPTIKNHRQLSVTLDVPRHATGLVLLVQARGSDRPGLLARGIAPVLRSMGLATCVVDLLEPGEANDLRKLCDVDFLADRLTGVVEYLTLNGKVGPLPLAILGREWAAAAATRVAAEQPERVRAVVCCSGRPDRAGIDVAKYQVPTLLLVPGVRRAMVGANERFFLQVRCEGQLAVIQDGNFIGESGTLAACQRVIGCWCARYLGHAGESPRTTERRGRRAASDEAMVRG